MKRISKEISAVFEKIPVVALALISLIKSFLIAGITITVLFFILWVTGVYTKIEAALDLKYNSPIILAPMWTFVALFVLCLMVGFLMYFHKYKRGRLKTAFYNAIAPALSQKK